MSKSSRGALEWGKSILILLLTLSAVFLSARIFFSGAGSQGGFLGGLLPPANPASSPAAGHSQPGVHPPVRMAVRNANGCYGVQYDDDVVGQLFDQLGGLLGEALGTAQAPAASSRRAWEDALTRSNGVYFSFLEAVPLPSLSLWLGSEQTALPSDGQSSRLLLAQDGPEGSVRLYYVDAGTGSYYSCETSVQFEELLNNSIPNGALFAFELPDRYGALDPDTLLLPKPPAPPIYTGGAAVDFSDASVRLDLLSALDFTPSANSIYPSADGWSVRDGGDTLRLSSDRTVSYHAGEGEARYPVSGSPSYSELAEATASLLDQTLAARCGSAGLYLSSYTQQDGVYTLTYSYSLSGAQVYLGQESWCARFTVSGGQITDYVLKLRTYSPSAETAVLLPEYQAMAAMEAMETAGSSLLLCYYDSGTGSVAPAWTAR